MLNSEAVDWRTPRDEAMDREEGDEGGAFVSDRAESLQRLFDFLTAKGRPIKRGLNWRAAARRGGTAAELLEAPETAEARAQDLALRVLASTWVVFPALLDGVSLRTLAARFGVSVQLLDHYVQMFSETFGIRGRGMKSEAASEVYAAAQRGNQNRLGKGAR